MNLFCGFILLFSSVFFFSPLSLGEIFINWSVSILILYFLLVTFYRHIHFSFTNFVSLKWFTGFLVQWLSLLSVWKVSNFFLIHVCVWEGGLCVLFSWFSFVLRDSKFSSFPLCLLIRLPKDTSHLFSPFPPHPNICLLKLTTSNCFFNMFTFPIFSLLWWTFSSWEQF